MKRIMMFACLCLLHLRGNSQMQTWEWGAPVTGNANITSSLIEADAPGNSYVAGSYWSGVLDLDPGAGVYNIWSNGQEDGFILKLDANGNFAWAWSFGGPYNDRCRDVTILPNGQVVILIMFEGVINCPGTTALQLNSNQGISALVWMDAGGNYIMHKQFGQLLSAGSCYLFEFDSDASGNIYAGGMFVGTVDFDPGAAVYTDVTYNTSFDMFVVSFDAAGNFRWEVSVGDSSRDESFIHIACNENGDISIAGTFDTRTKIGTQYYYVNNVQDIVLFHLTSNGAVPWGGCIGSPTYDYCSGITILPGGESVFLLTIGTCDVDPGPGTHMANLDASWSFASHLLKLGADGTFDWTHSFYGADYCQSIFSDTSNALYVGGNFLNAVDFDTGPGTFNLTAPTYEGFLARLDTAGNFSWVQHFDDSVEIVSVFRNSMDNLFITGVFTGATDMDPGAGTDVAVPDSGHFNLYVSRFSSINGISGPGRTPVSVSVYPVPSFSSPMVRIDNPHAVKSISVFNAIGQLVEEIETGIQSEMRLQHVNTAGVYFLTYYLEDGSSGNVRFEIL